MCVLCMFPFPSFYLHYFSQPYFLIFSGCDKPCVMMDTPVDFALKNNWTDGKAEVAGGGKVIRNKRKW